MNQVHQVTEERDKLQDEMNKILEENIERDQQLEIMKDYAIMKGKSEKFQLS